MTIVSFETNNNYVNYANAAALAAVDTSAYANGQIASVTGLGVFQLNIDSTATADNLTVIAATKGNWVLMTSAQWLMTGTNNVIDASQIGAVGGDLQLDNGTAAAPSLSFASDTNTGMYRVTTDSIGLTTGGTLRLTLSTTALTSTLPLALAAGSAAAPSIAIGGEQTGPYLAAAGSLGLAVAGAIKLNLTATALNMASGVALQVATVQVVGARNTGWTTFAGTGTKNQAAINVDTFTATDANIRLLGQGVKGILDALILHGLLGA